MFYTIIFLINDSIYKTVYFFFNQFFFIDLELYFYSAIKQTPTPSSQSSPQAELIYLYQGADEGVLVVLRIPMLAAYIGGGTTIILIYNLSTLK